MARGGSGRGRESKERGGRARLGYLSRGPGVPRYATGKAAVITRVAIGRVACTRCIYAAWLMRVSVCICLLATATSCV